MGSLQSSGDYASLGNARCPGRICSRRPLSLPTAPHEWTTTYKFESEVRQHRWVRLAERIAQGTHNPRNNPDINYDDKVPWGYILQVTRHGLVSGPLAEWWSHKVDQLRHSPRPDKQDAQSPSDLNFAQNNRWGVRKDHLKAARPPTPHAAKVQCTICGKPGHDASTCWLNPNLSKCTICGKTGHVAANCSSKGGGKSAIRPPPNHQQQHQQQHQGWQGGKNGKGRKGGKGGKGKPFRK